MLCILNPSRTHQIVVFAYTWRKYMHMNTETKAFMRLLSRCIIYPLQYDPHYSILFFFFFFVYIHGSVEIVYKLFFSKIEHSFGTPVKCFRYNIELYFTRCINCNVYIYMCGNILFCIFILYNVH